MKKQQKEEEEEKERETKQGRGYNASKLKAYSKESKIIRLPVLLAHSPQFLIYSDLYISLARDHSESIKRPTSQPGIHSPSLTASII